MSYSPSSSSNSPSSSAVASWYCWYSETRSFMFDSASVNSISSIPSPVYQCKKALRRNIAVKYSATRLNISWIDKTALCWCNEEDHCRIISMSKDGNVKDVFARFCALSDAMKDSAEASGAKLMHSEKLGFLGTCPSNIGTGLR